MTDMNAAGFGRAIVQHIRLVRVLKSLVQAPPSHQAKRCGTLFIGKSVRANSGRFVIHGSVVNPAHGVLQEDFR